MRSISMFGSCIFLIGCASTPYDNSRSIFRKIVGQWEWEEGPNDCKNLVNMAFRSNGTYTQTSESCDFADDGFGNFYYGWYVANNHICFAEVEEQFDDEKRRLDLYKNRYKTVLAEGYVKDRCPWKIERIEKNKIFIVEQLDSGETNSFFMVRQRWL
jgi:hypothetical protein